MAFSAEENAAIRETLLREARRCAVTLGLRKTSVEQLTEAAGISKGLFYKYFASKELLFFEVLEDISDHAQLQILLNAVEKGSNPWGCTDYLNQKKKILETGADVYELMNDYPVHTKAVLINDRLSVVGSYNLDMRSTYLDTELMLVIDSEKLSQQIHETESDYMEKSKEVLANGQETEGAKYQGKVLNRKKKLYYGVLRIIIRPLRQLL